MENIKYLSLFSGIGGLEHQTIEPLLFCERDEACRRFLQSRHPEVVIEDDVTTLVTPPSASFVVGGWPCQDLSSAGTLGGITASRSGLFFEMVRIAKKCGAHTIVGENVPNLLTINQGIDFQIVLKTLDENGYKFISWRVLNARSFGLPQERRRLFVVASSHREIAESLHSTIPLPSVSNSRSSEMAYGFYWTGGKRSICFSSGYVPTLKIGATDERGRAPVAVMYGSHVRKLSPLEFLRLQGFSVFSGNEFPPSTLLRMAGNAVAAPVGHFVVEAVFSPKPMTGLKTSFGLIGPDGISEEGALWGISHASPTLANNLMDFINTDSTDSLSPQAAAGLIVRSVRAKQPMPLELFDILWALSRNRSAKIKASRSNSIEALDQMEESEIGSYRNLLSSIS